MKDNIWVLCFGGLVKRQPLALFRVLFGCQCDFVFAPTPSVRAAPVRCMYTFPCSSVQTVTRVPKPCCAEPPLLGWCARPRGGEFGGAVLCFTPHDSRRRTCVFECAAAKPCMRGHDGPRTQRDAQGANAADSCSYFRGSENCYFQDNVDSSAYPSCNRVFGSRLLNGV